VENLKFGQYSSWRALPWR